MYSWGQSLEAILIIYIPMLRSHREGPLSRSEYWPKGSKWWQKHRGEPSLDCAKVQIQWLHPFPRLRKPERIENEIKLGIFPLKAITALTLTKQAAKNTDAQVFCYPLKYRFSFTSFEQLILHVIWLQRPLFQFKMKIEKIPSETVNLD